MTPTHILLCCLTALLLATGLPAQTLIWQDEFNYPADTTSPSSGTRTPTLEGGEGDVFESAYFGRCRQDVLGDEVYDQNANTLNTVSFTNYSNISGEWFWAGEEHGEIPQNNLPSPLDQTLDVLWSIPISGATNMIFRGLFAASSGNLENDDDLLYIEYRIDGGNWAKIIQFATSGPSFSSWSQDKNFNGTGDGVSGETLNKTFKQFSVSVPGAGTTLELCMRARINDAGDEWAADNFRLISCTLPPPNIAVTENSGNTPNDGIICFGGTATLNPGSYDAYVWSTGATTPSINVTPASTTTYSVTVTENGCTAFNNRTITVNPIPVPEIALDENSGNTSNDGKVCLGDTAILSVQPFSAYAWSPGGGNTQSIAVSPASNTTYSVTVTDALGCSNTDNLFLQSQSLPDPNLSVNETSGTAHHDGVTCAGAPVTLSVSGAGGGGVFSWSPGGETTNPINVNPDTTTTYTVTVTNNNGCMAAKSQVITVNPIPAPAIAATETSGLAGDGAICLGDSAILSAGSYASYSWSPGGASTSSIGVAPSATTLYSVTVTSAANCVGSGAFSLTVNPNPAPAITVTENSGNPPANNGVICAGDAVTLSTGVFSSYAWSPGGGSTQSINESPTGNITYTVTVTNAFGCPGTASQPITVNVSPVPVITATESSGVANNDASICAGDAVSLSAGSFASYLWSPGGAATATLNANPTTTTTYSVTVTNASGCTGTGSKQIIVTANPQPVIQAAESSGVANNDAAICQGDGVTLSAGTFAAYLWSPGGSAASTLTVSPGATTAYSVTATNQAGCTGSGSLAVTVHPNPVPVIAIAEQSGKEAGDGIVCIGDPLKLEAGSFQSYLWTPGGATAAFIEPALSADAAIGLEVTNSFGCKGMDEVFIEIVPEASSSIDTTLAPGRVFALHGTEFNPINPSGSVVLDGASYTGCDSVIYVAVHYPSVGESTYDGFSPNNDGVNEVFAIYELLTGNYPDNRLLVFNRWGDLVYEAEPYGNNWDGTYMGQPLPAGTYYYVLWLDKAQKDTIIEREVIIVR